MIYVTSPQRNCVPTWRKSSVAEQIIVPRLQGSGRWKWVAAAALLIALIVWTQWLYLWRHTDVVERKLTANSAENSVTSMAVSPDGKYLSYADNTGIYLKLIHTGETHPGAFTARFPCPGGRLVSGRVSLACFTRGTAWKGKLVEYFSVRRIAPTASG